MWKTWHKEGREKKNRHWSVRKNFARCGRKNFPRATKARIFIIKKCDWKNLEKYENAVSESRLKIPAESLQDAEREDDGQYCEESWQRLKGRTIILGETLVGKLDEAVCCRDCHPDVTFLENINCKSCVSCNKGVYCYPTACICDRTFSRGFFAGFNVLSFRIDLRLSGPGNLISLITCWWLRTADVKLWG